MYTTTFSAPAIELLGLEKYPFNSMMMYKRIDLWLTARIGLRLTEYIGLYWLVDAYLSTNPGPSG